MPKCRGTGLTGAGADKVAQLALTGEERVEAAVSPPLSASQPHYNVSFLLTIAGYWHIAVHVSPACCPSPSHSACLSVAVYIVSAPRPPNLALPRALSPLPSLPPPPPAHFSLGAGEYRRRDQLWRDPLWRSFISRAPSARPVTSPLLFAAACSLAPCPRMPCCALAFLPSLRAREHKGLPHPMLFVEVRHRSLLLLLPYALCVTCRSSYVCRVALCPMCDVSLVHTSISCAHPPRVHSHLE